MAVHLKMAKSTIGGELQNLIQDGFVKHQLNIFNVPILTVTSRGKRLLELIYRYNELMSEH